MGEPRKKIQHLLIALTFAALLSACDSDNHMKKVEKFIATVQQQKKPTITPLPTFISPTLPKNSEQLTRNPFAPPVEKHGLKPNTADQQSPLQSFPLTELRYVGSLSEPKQTWGLISTPTGTIYNIVVGGYIGQNYGKVVKITPQIITVEETVSNGLGGWVVRTKELTITSGSQQGSQP